MVPLLLRVGQTGSPAVPRRKQQDLEQAGARGWPLSLPTQVGVTASLLRNLGTLPPFTARTVCHSLGLPTGPGGLCCHGARGLLARSGEAGHSLGPYEVFHVYPGDGGCTPGGTEVSGPCQMSIKGTATLGTMWSSRWSMHAAPSSNSKLALSEAPAESLPYPAALEQGGQEWPHRALL